jgi:hypothetical protein
MPADGGWFALALDMPGTLPYWIGYLATYRSCAIRIATGDMAIFCWRQRFFALGGYPLQPLLEDVDFSRKLARRGKVVQIAAPVVTSSRRWQHRGWLRTILLMWWIRAAHRMGAKPCDLARWYDTVR